MPTIGKSIGEAPGPQLSMVQIITMVEYKKRAILVRKGETKTPPFLFVRREIPNSRNPHTKESLRDSSNSILFAQSFGHRTKNVS